MNTWKLAGSAFFAATIAMVIVPATAFAQQKTVKACEDEWKADKAGNQAKGITEKDYVAKCRAAGEAAKPAAATPAAAPKPAAATPAAAPKPATAAAPATAKKTVKACEDEWKADKAGNQAKGITEKDYVAKCRGDAATAATPAAPAPKPAAAAPVPAAPAPTTPPAKPAAAAPVVAPAAAPKAATAPTGAKQYAAEAQAKAQCPTDTVVWANLDSKIFHFAGHKDYGHTKKGAYMCEKDALAQSIRAAKDEKHP